MKITAQVRTQDGSPVRKGKVEVVGPAGVIGQGELADGALAAEGADPLPPVWGLTIDGQPVVAFPVQADDANVDLGEITLHPGGFVWPAFHAKRNRVFGVPSPVLQIGPAISSPGPFIPRPPLPVIEADKPVPVGLLFDSVAKQFAQVPPGPQGFRMTGATVTVRGVPSGSGDGFSIEFPNADLARNATGLSEVSFGLRPDNWTPGALASTSEGPTMPDVTGYTREFAVRKLAAQGLTSSVASEIVTEPTAAGRVVRQSPRAGEALSPGVPVQLFLGMLAGGTDGH
jgi:hypothetical protein